MADYWLAPALETFRAELNEAYPNRDKRSDGWIGDKYHAGGKSDHNPSQWPPKWKGVVRAYDADNDLASGITGQSLADHLAPMLGKHPALGSGAYLIYNSRIISADRLSEGWRKYSGKNPHKGHIHVSVASSPTGYDSTAPWGIGTPTSPAPTQEDDMKVIAKTRTNDQVWIGDGINRRRIATWDTLKAVQFLASKGILSVFKGGEIQEIDDLWSLGHPIDDDFALTKQAISEVAVGAGVRVDYDKIAKAVNDEAAKRLGAK